MSSETSNLTELKLDELRYNFISVFCKGDR